MKKIFTKNKASIYLCLSFLSLIVSVIVVVPLVYSSWSKFTEFFSWTYGLCLDDYAAFHRRYLWRRYPSCAFDSFDYFLFHIMMKPKETLHLAMPPLFAGLIFGILAITSHRKMPKPISKMVFASIGILLNSALLLFLVSAHSYLNQTMTAVVSKGAWERETKLDDGVVVGSFCVIPQNPDWGLNLPAYLVDVFEDTSIYEQYGTWFWQKRRVDMSALQPGQVVDIEYQLISDSEVRKLDPTNDFSIFPFGAMRITVRQGEFMPYEAGCGFYPIPSH